MQIKFYNIIKKLEWQNVFYLETNAVLIIIGLWNYGGWPCSLYGKWPLLTFLNWWQTSFCRMWYNFLSSWHFTTKQIRTVSLRVLNSNVCNNMEPKKLQQAIRNTFFYLEKLQAALWTRFLSEMKQTVLFYWYQWDTTLGLFIFTRNSTVRITPMYDASPTHWYIIKVSYHSNRFNCHCTNCFCKHLMHSKNLWISEQFGF